MADTEPKSLEVQEKKELAAKEEKTIPARFYVPYTDIYETEDALSVVMESTTPETITCRPPPALEVEM